LLVADVLHPIDDLAVLRFLNSDMRHRLGRRGAVPVFFAGRKPDDVARPNFLDGTTRALYAPDAASDDKRLAKRMRVPGRPGARLEGDAGAGGARRIRRLEKRIDAPCR
jgi:hypothetical protein